MKKKVKVFRTISDVLTAISVAMYAGILLLGGELTLLNKILLGLILVLYLIRFVSWVRKVILQNSLYKTFIKTVKQVECFHRLRYRAYFVIGKEETEYLSRELENLIKIGLSCEEELIKLKYLSKKQKTKVKEAIAELNYMRLNFQPKNGTL